MRSLALSALLGSLVASTSLVGQSLTEHAAAAAGATIGTAVGKPIGTELGHVFGNVDKTMLKAGTTKPAKATTATATKPAPDASPATTASTPVVPQSSAGGTTAGSAEVPAGGGGGGSSHHSARRNQAPVETAPVAAAPIVPVVAEPVIKEPTVDEVASIKVGVTSSELRAALGAPQSTISIPDDDGHLREVLQYWAKGEPIGVIRLD